MQKKRFDPDKAEVLFSKERQALLPAEKVVEYLRLKKEDTVADLGAGNGYFTLPIAKKNTHQVYAVDIEPKMLHLLKGAAEKEALENIQFIQSDLENIPLQDQSVDKVMAAFVIHEASDISKALIEASRILKSDGTLMIIEWEAVETENGPALGEKISAQEMVKLLEQVGFSSVVFHFNKVHYGILATYKSKKEQI